jgi:hypothetical protein
MDPAGSSALCLRKLRPVLIEAFSFWGPVLTNAIRPSELDPGMGSSGEDTVTYLSEGMEQLC